MCKADFYYLRLRVVYTNQPVKCIMKMFFLNQSVTITLTMAIIKEGTVLLMVR